MLTDCKGLDDYFRIYGDQLGARANKARAPLHLPTRDPVHPACGTLMRRPFDAQAHVVTAAVKAWQRQKSVLLAAEMGTGKTLIACSACHVAALGKPYRALVMCPDHLINKWEREIRETIPRACVGKFKDWKEVLAFVDQQDVPKEERGDHRLWMILGRDQSKFEPMWRPAFARRRHPIVEPGNLRNLREKGAGWDELTATIGTCPRCGAPIADKEGNPILAGKIKTTARLTCQAIDCGEPLWQFTRKPYRWAPARILHSRMKGSFDYLVIDEAHEEKSATSAQANAAGKLIASSRKVIALTGTLIGGYAEHVFPMTMRLAPRSLVAGGFEWGKFNQFNEIYGKIETTIHERSGKGSDDGPRNTQSMGSSRRVTKRCRPGVMPQLYGDHLIDKCIFLTLEEVRDGLPPLFEEIVPVDMDPEQQAAYTALQNWFRNVIKQQLAMGNKRLLGRMLMTLLGYPDVPHGWDTIDAGEDGSYRPLSLDPDALRPKEEALVALCRREKDLGRQCWVYIQMTQTKDVGPRLVDLLAKAGIRAGYLKSDVDRRKREEWIYKKGKDLDVVLSHPKLVETGLDLFAKDGNHNFSTLVYYQTGYNLFTLRQSSRRSWRIGQPLPCKTVFMFYRGTMQEQAMTLMGKKMAAAETLEGKFSAEGLAAMAGEDDATMALAKALLERVETPTDRAWSRSLGFAPQRESIPEPTSRPLTIGDTTFTADEIENLKRLHARLCGVG